MCTMRTTHHPGPFAARVFGGGTTLGRVFANQNLGPRVGSCRFRILDLGFAGAGGAGFEVQVRFPYTTKVPKP